MKYCHITNDQERPVVPSIGLHLKTIGYFARRESYQYHRMVQSLQRSDVIIFDNCES